jgi:ketosteroid isomerase-like protein
VGKQRYRWIGKPHISHDKSVEVIMKYFNCSSKDAKQYVKQLTSEDIVYMAEQLGFDKEQIKKLSS